jgi:hypothetical protein
MFNNATLDVVIGLIFVYLIYSLLATTIQEIIATKLSFRGKFLEKAIIRMLDDDLSDGKWKLKGMLQIWINRLPGKERAKKANAFSGAFYRHPMIKYLSEKNGLRKPAYLKDETFSKVVIDLLKGNQLAAGESPVANIQDTMRNGRLKWEFEQGHETANKQTTICPETRSYINSLWIDSQGDISKFSLSLQNWFKETMDRTSGWYKRYIQFVLFVVGLFLAVLFNVDTIMIVNKLQKDPTLRAQFVQQADAFVKAHPTLDADLKSEKDPTAFATDMNLKKRGDSLLDNASKLVQHDLNSTNGMLGMGIDTFRPQKGMDFFLSILGWLITAIAISLGAPFWFDLLNKFMKLRGAVAPPDQSNQGKVDDTPAVKINRVG